MNSLHMNRRGILLVLSFLSLSFLPACEASQDVDQLLTRAERSDFQETTRHDELMAFVTEVARRHPDIHLTTLGYTSEGRPLPLVVVGKVADASSEAVRATGKTRIYVQGGIHAGEICGKEALLILLRELAEGRHSQWADSLVLLIAPLYNADGNERVDLRNRGRQNGPIGGMGQRANAMGLDLNRDQMKLDAPESRSLVRLYTQYDPHLSVDLHVTNGSYHGYHLTYAPPLSPNTPSEIDEFLRERWLPEVTTEVKEETGWDMYYYGGSRPARGSQPAGWATFSHQPRYVSNYIGLRNRFGILGEAYSYATFEERIGISYWFTREIIEFAHGNAAEIQERTARADARPLVGDSLGVRATIQTSPDPVDILMGEVVEETNPFTGAIILRRTDTQIPTPMHDMGTFQSTEWERVPPAYFIPPGPQGARSPGSREIQEILIRLEAHGLQMSTLEAPETLEVEVFGIDSVTTSERVYEGHQAQEVWGNYGRETRTLEAGTIRIPMDQPLARVAFTLLEPRSDDGFVAWGFLPTTLQAGEAYPILRGFPKTP
jgi:hypothetical protein